MAEQNWLAKNFEQTRPHLEAVAYRMLGSTGEAEDAVQEAWLRLTRSGSEKIENLSGWLTTVVARICLDILRSRQTRREASLDDSLLDIPDDSAKNPDAALLIADAVGPALLVVLDMLTPSERIAFVLHDLFDLPFEEIAPIIDRTEVATRQLASRARRRVRGAPVPQDDVERQHAVVSAFLKASGEGDFGALIRLLHPEVILRADDTAVKVAHANKVKGAPQFKREITGAKQVADTFKGKAAAAQLALINGVVGATWAPGGKPVVAFSFSLVGDKIAAIEIVMEPKKLSAIDIEMIENVRE